MTPINHYLDDHNVKFGVVFLPASTVHQTSPLRDPRSAVNWRITLARTTAARGHVSRDFHYSQNLGFIRALDKKISSIVEAEQRKETVALAVEYGLEVLAFTPTGLQSQRIAPPLAADVLYFLLLDYRIKNYKTYEQWAIGTGYKLNSIADRCHYYYCSMMAIDLNAIFNNREIADIKQLIGDG